MIDKFKELAKGHDGIKELLKYIKNNKKTFRTLHFYQDFHKKQSQLQNEEKAKARERDKFEPIRTGSYLDEDEIYQMRYETDSRCSVASRGSFLEEIKVVSYDDQNREDEAVREFSMKQGKVRSTYMMKNDTMDTTFMRDLDADLDTINTLNNTANLIYRIIRHQLKNESHPIRMIIEQFSVMFVRSYKGFVNKSTTDVDQLYKNLEQMNMKIFSQHADGEKLKKLHMKKRQSEKRGNVQEADKTNLPNYFLSNQVIDDVKIFIDQMVEAVINFYSVITKKSDLREINEELIECMTDYILSGNLQKVVFSFFKLEAESKKKLLIQKYKDYVDIRPEHVGIDEKFALNTSSPIIQIYEYMGQQQMRINNSVFGSQYNIKRSITEAPEDEEEGSQVLSKTKDPHYDLQISTYEEKEDPLKRIKSADSYIEDESEEENEDRHLKVVSVLYIYLTSTRFFRNCVYMCFKS